MSESSSPKAEFAPADLAGFAKAYDRALDELNQTNGRAGKIPPTTVRNLLMSRIFSEARKGERNTERLKNAALGSMRDRLVRNPTR
jgi:hypothetical protein